MSKIKFSPDQQNVIDFKMQQDLLVSASAGSGKTEVLTYKIYDLLKNKKCDISEVLVVTFTVLAATEMKERLIKNLREGEDESLLPQIEKVALSDISTLHSFCQKVIKQNFFELKLDPSFSLMTEDNQKFLMAQCLENVLKNFSSEDEDYNNLVSLFKVRKDTYRLKENILDIYNFLLALDGDDFESKTIMPSYSENFLENPSIKFLNEHINFLFVTYKKTFNNLLKQSVKLEYIKMSEFLNKLCSFFDAVKENNAFEENLLVIKTMEALPQFRIAKNEVFEEVNLSVEKEFYAFKKDKEKMQEITSGSADDIKKSLSQAKKLIVKFLEIVKAFDREYSVEKQKKNLLDFNDLERQTLKILENKETRNKISQKYKYIYVDEYQDINGVQEKILQLISNNNLFMVGDVKQSIYGFRNSNPDIFIQKYENFKNASQSGTLAELVSNFRSDPHILSFINDIFSRVMTKNTCGIDYKKTSMFVAGKKHASFDEVPNVELSIIDVNKTKKQEAAELKLYSVKDISIAPEKQNAQLEAKVVADKIMQLQQQFADSGKEFLYKDIAILSRKKGEFLKDFTESLSKYKIPISTTLKERVADNLEISLIINYLKLISNENNDIALTSFLTSDFINLGFDDLVKIKKINLNAKFYENAKFYADNFDDEIAKKLKSFYNRLDEHRFFASFSTVYNLLNKLFLDYDIATYFMALPNGMQRAGLINKYIETFLGAEYNNNLESYLYYLENFGENSEFESPIISGDNSVLVGTIHSSKGLGFNTVFLIGAGENFSLNLSKSKTINKSQTLGVGIDNINQFSGGKTSCITKNAISLWTEKEEIAEEIRLLYVALTRAKENLIVVGRAETENLSIIKDENEVLKAKNYLSYILSTFSNEELNKLKTEKQVLLNRTGYDIKASIFQQCKIDSFEDKEILKKEIATEVIDKIKEYLEFNYDKTPTTLALKNTVTSLLEENAVGESYNYKPTKLSVLESMLKSADAAKIGSMYHFIMESIDWKQNLEDIFKHITKFMVENKNIDKTLIDLKKIKDAIINIKSFNPQNYFKEKRFLSYMPHSEIVEGSKALDKVLLQGVIDLLILGDKNILIDYKTTRISSDELLKKTHGLQLKIYKIAAEKALNIKVDEVYIYSFYSGKLIKL